VPALKAGAKRVAPAGKWIAGTSLTFRFKKNVMVYLRILVCNFVVHKVREK